MIHAITDRTVDFRGAVQIFCNRVGRRERVWLPFPPMQALTLANALGAGLVGGLLLICISIVVYSVRTGISPMPSTARARARLLAALPQDPTGPIYELGSGWGTLAFALADRFPHCEVIGYELSPVPFLVASLRQRLFPRANLSFWRKDLFAAPLAGAAIVVCYLCPPLMRRLAHKLQSEAKPGTIVASNTFSIPVWPAAEIHPLHDLYDNRIYLYRVPAPTENKPAGFSA